MMPNLIGLYSPAMGCGKTTVAQHLIDQYDYTPIRFAGPLKDMLRTLLVHMGVREEHLRRYTDGDLKETNLPGFDITARRALQTLGTDWGRAYVHPEVWVRIASDMASNLIKTGGLVVIDDMRFPNEYEAVKALGGQVWMVTRPGATITQRHSSEGKLDGHKFDLTIHNRGSVEYLKETVTVEMLRINAITNASVA
jgi:hypothetical protein